VDAFLKREGRHAVFSAQKSGSIEVDEVAGQRPLRDYMVRPAAPQRGATHVRARAAQYPLTACS
jgi:hypothetical protein